VIAATNRDLHEAISAGTFRDDLFYRLAVLSLTLPPLRERRSDISQIAERLLAQINRQFKNEEPGFTHKILSASATAFVKQQSWPGNVRQLYNVLTQAAVLADGTTLGRGDLASALGQLANDGRSDSRAAVTLGDGFVLNDYLNRLQIQLLERAMRQARGNKTQAARLLGIENYQTLAARLKRLGVAWNDKSME